MPCKCDYMEPDRHEVESKRACQLLVYALPLVGKPIPEWIASAAKNYYGEPERLEEATVMLCTLCGGMDDVQKSAVIYDGRNAESRKLADWWDEHQKADEAREIREKQAAVKAEIRARAIGKLTLEERDALSLKNDEWWHRRDQAPIQLETLSPVATHGLFALVGFVYIRGSLMSCGARMPSSSAKRSKPNL
jgi:hypothetical protein